MKSSDIDRTLKLVEFLSVTHPEMLRRLSVEFDAVNEVKSIEVEMDSSSIAPQGDIKVGPATPILRGAE